MSFVQTVAGFTFHVGWDEREQDYVGTIHELPDVRVFYGNQAAAFRSLARHAARALERDAQDSREDAERLEKLRDFTARLAEPESN